MGILKKWLQRRRAKARGMPKEPEEPSRKENPYLPQLWYLLKQILQEKQLPLREMRLLILDTDRPPESLLTEDDVSLVLAQMSEDLNFLTIWTDRPAYFEDYVETMYEENGLLVQVEGKRGQGRSEFHVLLDFEQKGGIRNIPLKEPSLYISIYKKSWETAENLDICIPIGYNTVIVKGIN